MEPVVCLRPRPHPGHLGGDRAGAAEQLQGLVDQMGSEIVPHPGTWDVMLPPAVADLRPEPVEVRLEVADRADGTLSKGRADGQEVAVEAAVLEGRHRHPRRRTCGQHRRRLRPVQGKGLLHQHRLARGDGLQGQRGVPGIGGGDHHQLHRRVGQQGVGRGHDPRTGAGGLGLPGTGGADRRQRQFAEGRDQRRVEGAARIAEADEADPDRRRPGQWPRSRGSTRSSSAAMASMASMRGW